MAEPAHAKWTVLPHGPIERLEENLWHVQGSLPNMPLKRVMTLARLASGDLVVHNPVALGAEAMADIEAFGRPAFLVVPNGWHRLDARVFAERYPSARVLAPAAARKKVAAVIEPVGELTDLPANPAVELALVDGTRGMEALMTVRSANGVSLVLADCVFNMPHERGVLGWILKHVTGSSGGPRISRVARLGLIKDKLAFRAHLERLATPDLVRIIVAHHAMITIDPAGTLRRVAATLAA